MPIIRERGDFCRNEADGCKKGYLRYADKRKFPDYLSTGLYNVETLIYNEETRIPMTCKKFSLDIVNNQKDNIEQKQQD